MFDDILMSTVNIKSMMILKMETVQIDSINR